MASRATVLFVNITIIMNNHFLCTYSHTIMYFDSPLLLLRSSYQLNCVILVVKRLDETGCSTQYPPPTDT